MRLMGVPLLCVVVRVVVVVDVVGGRHLNFKVGGEGVVLCRCVVVASSKPRVTNRKEKKCCVCVWCI